MGRAEVTGMTAPSRCTRVLATTVLAAGAVASIATSSLAWQLEASAPVPATILDVAKPSVGYRVHAELTGPFPDPSGTVELRIEVTFPPDRPNPASLLVEITDDDDADNSEVVEVTVSPDSGGIYAYLSAWQGCEAAPCVEDFTVWIERTDLEGPPVTPIMLHGDVRIQAGEPGGAEPPAGSELTVTVTEIEEQP